MRSAERFPSLASEGAFAASEIPPTASELAVPGWAKSVGSAISGKPVYGRYIGGLLRRLM